MVSSVTAVLVSLLNAYSKPMLRCRCVKRHYDGPTVPLLRVSPVCRHLFPRYPSVTRNTNPTDTRSDTGNRDTLNVCTVFLPERVVYPKLRGGADHLTGTGIAWGVFCCGDGLADWSITQGSDRRESSTP